LFLDHRRLVPSQPVLAIPINFVDHFGERTLSRVFQDLERLLFVVAETHQQDQLFSHAWIEITEIPFQTGVYALEAGMKGKRVSA
jgi:hypothetical protein